jgi:hypothetical protein
MKDTPTKNPRDESHVHRMPDFREQTRSNEMVDVLNPSELDQCSNGQDHTGSKNGKAKPSNRIWQLYLKWVETTQIEP